jgi:hypothetical protein
MSGEVTGARVRRRGHRYLSFVLGCICMRIFLLMPAPTLRTSREAVVMPSFKANPRQPFPEIRQNNSTHNDAHTKPTLVLHMGPPKTSSTYLQCILTNMIDTLALDNYNYLDLKIEQCKKTPTSTPTLVDHQQQRHCYDIFAGKYAAKIGHTFLQSLEEAVHQGRNAIIVNECFM